MNTIQEALNKYIQDTKTLLQLIDSVVSELEIKATQNERDRDQVIKDRAALIEKSNTVLRQVDSMREDWDQANNKIKEAEKLRDASKEDMARAERIVVEMDAREKILLEREEKLKDLDAKEKNVKQKEDAMNELIQLREGLDIKANFIRKEQELLYDKQKALELREAKVQTQENRLRQLHND